MKALRSLLTALALMALFAVPAFAQDDAVTLGFEVTGAAGCPEDTTFFGLVGPPFSEFGGIQLRDEDGDGVYMGSTEVGAGEPLVVQIVQGVGTVDTQFGTFPGEPVTLLASFSSSEDPQEFVEDRTLEAAADCDVPDNQQDGGKDTGAGKTPDNQQGGDMVTKTFELTLNGDVPTDRAFAVFYGTRDEFNALFEFEGDGQPFSYILVCGQPEDAQFADTVISDDDCVGNGNTYTAEVELPQGTELFFSYAAAVETDLMGADFFFGNVGTLFETGEVSGEPEVLDADMTNTAWYTFGKGTGAGDEQETPDNQQDDQEGEMPGEMPDTGAGGLATGASMPWGSLGLAASGMLAAGYAVLRRR